MPSHSVPVPRALLFEDAGTTRRNVLAWAALVFGSSCNKRPKSRDPREVIQAANDFVKVRLVSAGTAAFGGEADTVVDEISPGRYRVSGLVDYSGLDGGTMRVNFTCVLSNENGRWNLEEMNLR